MPLYRVPLERLSHTYAFVLAEDADEAMDLAVDYACDWEDDDVEALYPLQIESITALDLKRTQDDFVSVDNDPQGRTVGEYLASTPSQEILEPL